MTVSFVRVIRRREARVRLHADMLPLETDAGWRAIDRRSQDRGR